MDPNILLIAHKNNNNLRHAKSDYHFNQHFKDSWKVFIERSLKNYINILENNEFYNPFSSDMLKENSTSNSNNLFKTLIHNKKNNKKFLFGSPLKVEDSQSDNFYQISSVLLSLIDIENLSPEVIANYFYLDEKDKVNNLLVKIFTFIKDEDIDSLLNVFDSICSEFHINAYIKGWGSADCQEK